MNSTDSILGRRKSLGAELCALAARKAKSILRCLKSCSAIRLMGGRSHLEFCVQSCPSQPPIGKGTDNLWAAQQEPPRGLKHLTCEQGLREVGWFSLEKKQHWGNLNAASASEYPEGPDRGIKWLQNVGREAFLTGFKENLFSHKGSQAIELVFQASWCDQRPVFQDLAGQSCE